MTGRGCGSLADRQQGSQFFRFGGNVSAAIDDIGEMPKFPS
jgi:hypothetical protein